MGRRSHYKGEKRRKGIKRLAGKEAKRRNRFGKNGEAGQNEPTFEEWGESFANLHRAGGSEREGSPVVSAAMHPLFFVSREELEVLKSMEASVPIRWRENMTKAKNGDEVKAHYRGTLEDGT